MKEAAPRLSVVLASYNRPGLLTRLLSQLAQQTLPPSEFEVVVVDDGSKEPVEQALGALQVPYRLTIERQTNAGAAAARHRGVQRASGDIVLITDDDMQVHPDFLERHLAYHREGTRLVVLGRIGSDPALSDMPLFERWYAHLFDKMADRLSVPGAQVRGSHLYTGNVSMRRADYLSVGGFDSSLGHSEDVELGLKLESAGARFVFAPEAIVLHGSDHTSLAKWLARANRYGVFDSRIALKHPDAAHANPWRMLFELHPLARPFLTTAWIAPRASKPLSSLVLASATVVDLLGLKKPAYAGMTVAYTMEYYRGVRGEAGSWKGSWEGFRQYVKQRKRAAKEEALK